MLNLIFHRAAWLSIVYLCCMLALCIQILGADIQNCKISFNGVTGQLVSSAMINFTTPTAINSNKLVIKLSDVGPYALSTNSMYVYPNKTCAISVNGGIYSAQVSANKSNLNQPYFTCLFNNINLAANSNIGIRLSNILNPPFKNSYFASGKQFGIITSDGNIDYDNITQCIAGDVTIDKYEAKLSN